MENLLEWKLGIPFQGKPCKRLHHCARDSIHLSPQPLSAGQLNPWETESGNLGSPDVARESILEYQVGFPCEVRFRISSVLDDASSQSCSGSTSQHNGSSNNMLQPSTQQILPWLLSPYQSWATGSQSPIVSHNDAVCTNHHYQPQIRHTRLSTFETYATENSLRST